MCIFALGAAAGAGSALSAITTVASIGIGIAQAMAANAAAQAEYQNQVQWRKQQEIQAQKTLNLQVAQQQQALESQKDKAQGAKAEYAIEGYAAKSRAQAISAESGVVGLSVDNLIGDITARTARATGKIDYNAAVAGVNANNELKMAQRGLGARLAEIPIPVKPKFNMGLAIASNVVSGLSGLAKIGGSTGSVPGYTNPQGNYIF